MASYENPSIEIEGELNAVTANPDQTLFCVAGLPPLRPSSQMILRPICL